MHEAGRFQVHEFDTVIVLSDDFLVNLLLKSLTLLVDFSHPVDHLIVAAWDLIRRNALILLSSGSPIRSTRTPTRLVNLWFEGALLKFFFFLQNRSGVNRHSFGGFCMLEEFRSLGLYFLRDVFEHCVGLLLQVLVRF